MIIRELTQQDFDKVVEVFGEKITEFQILKFEKNNCNLGVFDNEDLIGVITAEPRNLIKPLDAYTDFLLHILKF